MLIHHPCLKKSDIACPADGEYFTKLVILAPYYQILISPPNTHTHAMPLLTGAHQHNFLLASSWTRSLTEDQSWTPALLLKGKKLPAAVWKWGKYPPPQN